MTVRTHYANLQVAENASPEVIRGDLIFDNRYFMASTEVNLLNTLLLADDKESDLA